MWPPVSELLVPLSSNTTEVPQNDIQPELQVNIHTVDCQSRDKLPRLSLRRVARTEPLYRRAHGIRQQPYTVSGAHITPANTTPDHEQALQLGITNNDIQAARILMLISKSHEVQSGELSVYQDDSVSYITQSEMATHNSEMCVCCASSDDCTLPTNWLQTLRRQPRQRLLRILCSLSIPPFDWWNEGRSWKSDVNAHMMMSCTMASRMVPSLSVPAVLQQAVQVAGHLVNLAHLKKMPKEQDVCCADCGALPVVPITGQCGHTRCVLCIMINSSCTCGAQAPAELRVDVCVQHLVGKILTNKQPSRVALRAPDRPPVRGQALHLVCAILSRVIQENCQALARRHTVAQRLSRGLRVSLTISRDSFTAPDVPARLPMTPQARVLHACELIRQQRYSEAAPHLARAATYIEFHFAKKLLVQTIAILMEEEEPERVLFELAAAVGGQAAETWLTPADLLCVLCRDTFVSPVTTPCGHTYCRNCIECSMDFRKTCPLCRRDLTNFNLALTRPSGFLCAALDSIGLLPSPTPHDPNVVPVFICITAFPKLSCPLLISSPRYLGVIRRILESGSRRLGIVARNEDLTDSYGTMMEVQDCVECEDGQLILSTIGVSRFRIVERLMDSCLARVETFTDKIPEDSIMGIIRDVGINVMLRSLIWLKNLETSVLCKLERAFGKIPLDVDVEEEWWKNPDGPDWLWWLVASLPLAPELQSMMIASCNLLTRLRVIQRTLQLVTGMPAAEHVAYDVLREEEPE